MMKQSLMFSAIATALFLSAPAAWAENHMHGHDHAAPGKPMAEKDQQMQMGKMQENMLKMHEQMHKIQDAKNPQERERLMQEQRKTMQERMNMMREMKGEGGNMGGMK